MQPTRWSTGSTGLNKLKYFYFSMQVLLVLLVRQGTYDSFFSYTALRSILPYNRKYTCLTQCNTHPSDNQSKINNHQCICIWTWNQKHNYFCWLPVRQLYDCTRVLEYWWLVIIYWLLQSRHGQSPSYQQAHAGVLRTFWYPSCIRDRRRPRGCVRAGCHR